MQPLAERMRPKTLDDYVGQTHLVGPGAVLRRAVETKRLPSFILWGPPGVGKTTLAKIIANQVEVPFYMLSAINSGVKDVRDTIDKAKRGTFFDRASPILFIDEIHRLNNVVEEYLYSAMEDYRIDIMIDSGPNARSVQINLEPFTLVGATTRMGLLTAPMRARFGINCLLDYYDIETLVKIIKRSCEIMKVPVTADGAMEIARRSRGTPRIANALLRRIRDFAQIKGDGNIDKTIADYGLSALNVDEGGLDDMDNKILDAIINKFKGGPVGVSTIATAVGEDTGTIEEVHEPFLIMEGYLQRTPRGRQATEKAYHHIGAVPPGAAGTLFEF